MLATAPASAAGPNRAAAELRHLLPGLAPSLASRPARSCICGFGFSEAITSTLMAAGASGGGSNNAGQVYVYSLVHRSWRRRSIINDPSPNAFGDNFGQGVALAGSELMVAAAGSGNKDSSGVAYIYGLLGQHWQRQATLVDPLGASTSRNYLASMWISGSIAMIGYVGANSDGSGEVYLYRLSSGPSGKTWHRAGEITEPLGADGDFGWDLAFSGSLAIIGDPGTHGGAGSAFVYARSEADWRERAVLADPGRKKDDYFGEVVALSGSTAVISSSTPGELTGRVYLYSPKGTSWSLRGTLTSSLPGNRAEFGWSAAISGTRLLVGAPDRNAKTDCGTAYEFARKGNAWPLRAQINDPKCRKDDKFGYSLALTGRSAVIGAPGADDADGAIYTITVP
jgi:hypothetical protein